MQILFMGQSRRQRRDERTSGCTVSKKRTGSIKRKGESSHMSGCVYVENQKEDKAGSMFADTANIEVRGNTLKYDKSWWIKTGKSDE